MYGEGNGLYLAPFKPKPSDTLADTLEKLESLVLLPSYHSIWRYAFAISTAATVVAWVAMGPVADGKTIVLLFMFVLIFAYGVQSYTQYHYYRPAYEHARDHTKNAKQKLKNLFKKLKQD